MTARRLRRKNKSDVKRFLYVPLPIGTVSSVGVGEAAGAIAFPWNAVIGRILPQIIALSQFVAFCRKAA